MVLFFIGLLVLAIALLIITGWWCSHSRPASARSRTSVEEQSSEDVERVVDEDQSEIIKIHPDVPVVVAETA